MNRIFEFDGAIWTRISWFLALLALSGALAYSLETKSSAQAAGAEPEAKPFFCGAATSYHFAFTINRRASCREAKVVVRNRLRGKNTKGWRCRKPPTSAMDVYEFKCVKGNRARVGSKCYAYFSPPGYGHGRAVFNRAGVSCRRAVQVTQVCMKDHGSPDLLAQGGKSCKEALAKQAGRLGPWTCSPFGGIWYPDYSCHAGAASFISRSDKHGK
jgi:hypothetical protein